MKYSDVPVSRVHEILGLAGLAVLDLRDTQTYAQGHLPEAVQADSDVVEQFIKGRQYDKPVLIYCYHGHMSRDMAELFAFRGFRNIFNLEGGWQAWLEYEARGKLDGQHDELGQWLEVNGFDRNRIDDTIKNGMTPLMIAALNGEGGITSKLLERGADVSQLNDDGNNALWFACVGNQPGIAQLLIAHGVDIDNQNVNGATCLIYAASAGRSDLVVVLVEAGADPHRRTLDDFTALDSAATLPILKYLKPMYMTKAGGHA